MGLIKVRKRSGSVLILSLWTLMFLVIFAVQIGMKIRQRISLLSRIETRNRLHFIATSGVKKAISALKLDWEVNGQNYTPDGKYFRHNNPVQFQHIPLGDGHFSVSYDDAVDYASAAVRRFGFVDEERKININNTHPNILIRLIENVGVMERERAAAIAYAIISWREYGEKEIEGFYSDDYYANLQYPYSTKNAPFEILAELKLVKGISESLYNKLSPYITVYGNGRININTAPREVLLALGLTEEVVDKIIFVRRGEDGIEATQDDTVFLKTFDIASEISLSAPLNEEEFKQIDTLNAANVIQTNSFYFLIKSHATLEDREDELTVACLYNKLQNRIDYWVEK